MSSNLFKKVIKLIIISVTSIKNDFSIFWKIYIGIMLYQSESWHAMLQIARTRKRKISQVWNKKGNSAILMMTNVENFWNKIRILGIFPSPLILFAIWQHIWLIFVECTKFDRNNKNLYAQWLYLTSIYQFHY